MTHLSDEEIQAYLDGDPAVDEAAVARHLTECPVCREACEQYRALYVALADDSHVYAPARGEQERARVAASDRADAVVGAWAMAATAVVAAAVLAEIGGPWPAGKALASALGNSLRGVADLLLSAVRAAAAVNHDAGVAALAGLVVCAALALDRLLLEPLLYGVGPRRRP